MRDLVRQFREEKGLTQAKLAALLGVSEASVNNWERGKNRPTPAALAKMVSLVGSKLAEKLRSALENYKWHPGQLDRIGERELHKLPPDLDEALERLAKKHGLDTSVILLQALRTGLAALSRDASPDWKTLVKRQADIARRVEDREHPAKSSRKHRRSKVA